MGVEMRTRMQTDSPAASGLAVRLFGPPELRRDGVPVALPPSRKARALLAYLALSSRPASRSHLCELLWDLPSDPRGELRWCLSKLRTVLDDDGRGRVVTDGEGVAVDLRDGTIDAVQVQDALRAGLATLPAERLQALAELLARGELLEGLDLPRSPAFTGWLVAERRRFRAAHAAVLEHRVRTLEVGSDAALAALERWLAVTPFDRQAHEQLLQALAARGRIREGDEHVAAAARQYEAEGQDWAPIGRAWQQAKARHAFAQVPVIQTLASPIEAAAAPAAPARRASLAVLPFSDRSPGVPLRGGLADGMAHDIITRLAKLRSMFVIAEGTMFALAERRVDSDDSGRRLDVDYVASGSLRRTPGGHLAVSVQLAETRSAQVVWGEEFSGRIDDTFAVLDEIGNRIVTAIAHQVEVAERNRAILKNPASLDAWESHHRGLWHMMRFHREDNEQARQFFRAAARLDPTFARPLAGLSFTHFQDAFLGWGDRRAAIEQAYRAAADGVMADEHDPASHWALGRAMWLRNSEDDEALRELRAAIELSPNFALGHYTLGFVHAQSGDPETAIAEADHARALSPLDPLLFGMLASRALALARLGRYDEAADWGARSAARPNAHVHIQAIAMVCVALAGRKQEAQAFATAIQRAQPGYGIDAFLQAFKFGGDAESLVRQAMRSVAA
ncbi:transcriptional regulator [Ramlibacter sp. HM2]|uniref:Transcriptional regulator n=2 Tax=Ramlibacter pallidus TaxID=2780087 RepID=A0ABR9S7X3_9BURK|nr:transcriptional regulator [Ramlibacter pallidus]